MSEKIIDSNYGSIPHLSTSKMFQQADKKITPGQEKILTSKARDWKDLVIVTEKIDGSNVGIVSKGGALIPVTRAGYHALTSKYTQHHLFAKWLKKNVDQFLWLVPGWRICGEWCLQAHGTFYDIRNYPPFIVFDIIDDNNERLPFLQFKEFCDRRSIPYVPLLHIGQPISIDNAVKLLGKGRYGEAEKPEGVVYRVEREGKVDFLAKWVRADKEDGKYMKDEIWNAGSEQYL